MFGAFFQHKLAHVNELFLFSHCSWIYSKSCPYTVIVEYLFSCDPVQYVHYVHFLYTYVLVLYLYREFQDNNLYSVFC